VPTTPVKTTQNIEQPSWWGGVAFKMIGGSFFLSVLPKGLFSFAVEGGTCGHNPLAMVVTDDSGGRKRLRDMGGSRTPTLISIDDNERPAKRLRGHCKTVDFVPPLLIPISAASSSTSLSKDAETGKAGPSISRLPRDVLAHCLSFLGSAEDRYALQTTCKLFRDLSNADSMLANVNVAGDQETGKGGIIQEHDTPASAAAALSPFARAGNLEAQYMYVISTQI
jgi:hypothetical protein